MFRRGIPPAYIPNAVVFFSDATIVFAALAVEEFLNFYGVVRLGERTYLKHCERKSPVSKLKILLATCCGAHTNDDSEIVRSAEQIFRHRNRLVHPQVFDTALKHRELPKPESNSDLAGDSIANLERFTTLFSGYDPEAIELGGL